MSSQEKPGDQAPASISLRQAGAGGALRCAQFAIDDAARHLEWHFQEQGLPREEYLALQAKIADLRLAAGDALKPLWALASTPE